MCSCTRRPAKRSESCLVGPSARAVRRRLREGPRGVPLLSVARKRVSAAASGPQRLPPETARLGDGVGAADNRRGGRSRGAPPFLRRGEPSGALALQCGYRGRYIRSFHAPRAAGPGLEKRMRLAPRPGDIVPIGNARLLDRQQHCPVDAGSRGRSVASEEDGGSCRCSSCSNYESPFPHAGMGSLPSQRCASHGVLSAWQRLRS